MFHILGSNAIKFTPEGKVGIKLYVVQEPPFAKEGLRQKSKAYQPTTDAVKEEKQQSKSQTSNDQNGFHSPKHGDDSANNGNSLDGDLDDQSHLHETTVWICCDVYDTGIGIPGISNAFQ